MAAKAKAPKKAVYDESKIKTLSSIEHIRLRTGMYIGRLGDGSNPDEFTYHGSHQSPSTVSQAVM